MGSFTARCMHKETCLYTISFTFDLVCKPKGDLLTSLGPVRNSWLANGRTYQPLWFFKPRAQLWTNAKVESLLVALTHHWSLSQIDDAAWTHRVERPEAKPGLIGECATGLLLFSRLRLPLHVAIIAVSLPFTYRQHWFTDAVCDVFTPCILEKSYWHSCKKKGSR